MVKGRVFLSLRPSVLGVPSAGNRTVIPFLKSG